MTMRILITGGAGFIGSNLAYQLISEGHEITIFDNLSRRGTELNLIWLKENHRDRFQFIRGDVRDGNALMEAVKGREAVYHLAAQVAVTTSITDPRTDFDINALGTLNVLEAIRRVGDNPIVIFTSTNKVYGEMKDAIVIEQDTRYAFRDFPEGISENQGLDFHSPYGCSKGASDQYVRDYSRIYGIRSIVFRMSCIYGIRQFGNEDQGWIAHFLISAALGKNIIIYGDGKQVRDVLFINDLVQAFKLAVKHINVTSGQVYNIGGGSQNTLSIWAEFKDLLARLAEHKISFTYSDQRPGDQPIYISNIGKAQRDFGWKPKIKQEEGVRRLWDWVIENRHLFE